MNKKKKQRGKLTRVSAKPRGGRQRTEWVGGKLVSPFYITGAEPFRPEMILWLELPQDLIIGNKLLDPETPPVPFAASLLETMKSPAIGPPRRPDRVRVADALLAAELRAALPELEVVVAPTPELDRILQHLVDSMAAEDDGEKLSYFEGGRIGEERVAALFRAAALLYRVAPWKILDDEEPLRLDVPALGVQGACLTIIGALGESLGFVIFDSLAAYERFLAAAEEGLPERGAKLDLGSETLSLNFERAPDLPPTMRKEAALHRWPVPAPAAYPLVQHRDRDGLPRPLTERDLRQVTVCAAALATLFTKHRQQIDAVEEPLCASFFEDALEVRLTLPYEAAPLSAITRAPPGRQAAPAKVGRNEPCPCGSGKKYKKCCQAQEQAAASAARAPAALHALDQRLVEQMFRFALQRFGQQWVERAAEDFIDPDQALPLFMPWTVYHFLLEGKPVVQWYLDKRGRQLSAEERAWLQAQRASWLSVWEVTAVEPGRSLTLKDLLTGEERTVHEVKGSSSVSKRDALLGSVVSYGEQTLLGASHPRLLPPLQAAEVVQRVRGRLRRKQNVPPERLREEKTGRYLIARWEEAVEQLDRQQSVPPRLQNTDGDDLLLTVDHFTLAPGALAEVQARLAALEGVEPPAPEDKEQVYCISRPGNPLHDSWENTLIGRVTLSEAALRLETNSIRRADSLRQKLEAACTGLLRHRAREHADPLSQLQSGALSGRRGKAEPELPVEEVNQFIREAKQKHYASWPDLPLPALGGQTAREACRTKAGREQVDLLLKNSENHEAREPAEQRFDFSQLRRELKLDQ